VGFQRRVKAMRQEPDNPCAAIAFCARCDIGFSLSPWRGHGPGKDPSFEVVTE